MAKLPSFRSFVSVRGGVVGVFGRQIADAAFGRQIADDTESAALGPKRIRGRQGFALQEDRASGKLRVTARSRRTGQRVTIAEFDPAD